MKKDYLKLLCLLFISFIISGIYAQDSSTNKIEASASKKGKPVYSLFHMYMEYASGELSSKVGERALSQLDTKITYLQNFKSAPWLSMGFIGQISWNYGADKLFSKLVPGSKPHVAGSGKFIGPSEFNLSASVGFCDIFSVWIASTGMLSPTIFYTRQLPKVNGLYSHAFTFLLTPSFYMLGNQRNNGQLLQGWFDKLEMRVAYQMKFTKWFGLRPEFLFNFSGTPLIAGSTAREAFFFRFNPRFQFFYEEFSFFIEPRFFYVGDTSFFANKENFQWEIKIGFDITKLWLR
ncbi:MAG: hypothetical protein ACRCTJ_00435 [Brevinema sp.]